MKAVLLAMLVGAARGHGVCTGAREAGEVKAGITQHLADSEHEKARQSETKRKNRNKGKASVRKLKSKAARKLRCK